MPQRQRPPPPPNRLRRLGARLTALAVVLALLLTGFVVVLLRSGTPNCTVVVDRPVLPASLTALGDFQQPYNALSPSTLEDVAVRAGSAAFPALIGATAEAPVTLTGSGGRPTALVVPLRAVRSGASSPVVVGLAVFEEDCAGNAFFERVEDDSALQPPLQSFPPVTRAMAVASLGAFDVILTWSTSPLQPVWEVVGRPAASLAAR